MTDEEVDDYAFRLAHGQVEILALPWREMSEDQQKNLLALARYESRRMAWQASRKSGAQKRARGLLRSLLSKEQRRQLRSSHGFQVVGSLGGRYRLHPETGSAERLERHGKRWFGVVRYCLHDPGRELPPADVSVSHLLLLRADEGEFLRVANATVDNPWDGEWRRRLNAERRRRAA